MEKTKFAVIIKILALFLPTLFFITCSSGKHSVNYEKIDSFDSIYDLYLKANRFDSSTIKYIKNQYLIDLLVNASKNEQIGLHHQAIIDLLDAYRFDSSKVILFAIAKNFYMIEKLTLAFDYAIKSYIKDTNFTPTIELLAWILLTRNQPELASYFSTKLVNLKGSELTLDELKLHLEVLDKVDTSFTQSITFLKKFEDGRYEDFVNAQLHYRYYLRGDSLNEFTVLQKIFSKEKNLKKVDLIYLQRYLSLLLDYSNNEDFFKFLSKILVTLEPDKLDNLFDWILTNMEVFTNKLPEFSEKLTEILEQNVTRTNNGNFILLKAYFVRNDSVNSCKFAQKILNNEEIDLNILVVAAKVLFYNCNDKEIALKKFLSFKFKFTEESAYYITLGEFYLDFSNYELAASSFERALSLDSFYTEPYFYLGWIYFEKEDWEKSDYYYSKCLELNPENPVALNNYAYSLIIREKNLPYAFSLIEKAIKQKPDDPNFLDTYGWYFYKIGKYEEAKKFIEKSIQIDSSRAEPFFHLSLIYEALGNQIKSKENFEKAIKIDPNNKEILRETNKKK